MLLLALACTLTTSDESDSLATETLSTTLTKPIGDNRNLQLLEGQYLGLSSSPNANAIQNI